MAVGTIILTPGAATLPDGSASNLAPGMTVTKSSATAPGVYTLKLLYDPTSEEWAVWQFRMPDDYASTPIAKLQWAAVSATSGAVVWDVRISATTPGDTTDIDAQDFAAANTATTTVPATAGYLAETSVTLTNADSLAAGDLVIVRVARAAADGSDTATGDAELLVVGLTYTTT
jgi:hypothetical protein